MARDYRLIDVSHSVHDGMITYKGLPAPRISDHLSREASKEVYAPGTEFHIGRIEMVANTGTYLDSPFHRYPQGRDLSELDLYSLANLQGVVIRCSSRAERAIDQDVLADLELRDKAVIFHTGWDKHWRTENYLNGQHPFLTKETADFLLNSRVRLVGIDSYNIDNTDTGERPVHSALLAADIAIVEHMCGLGDLPDSGFRFFAVPVKVSGFGTFPVRAFGLVSDL
jgi:kynurenine formamidase